MFEKTLRLEDKKVLEQVRGQGCCVCGQHPVDASHIKTKGSGGPDTLWNVVAHCRRHHMEWHSRGWKDFSRRNPVMAVKLKSLGWTWEDGKLWNPKLATVEIAETPVTTPVVKSKKRST
jgi:hypothetical protein